MTLVNSNVERTGKRLSAPLEALVHDIVAGIEDIGRASIYYQYCDPCSKTSSISDWFEAFFTTDTEPLYSPESAPPEITALGERVVRPSIEAAGKFLTYANNRGSTAFTLMAHDGLPSVVSIGYEGHVEDVSVNEALRMLLEVHRSRRPHVPRDQGCCHRENPEILRTWHPHYQPLTGYPLSDANKWAIYTEHTASVSSMIRAVPYVRHTDTDTMIVDMKTGRPVLIIEESTNANKPDAMSRKLAVYANSGACPVLKIITNESDPWYGSSAIATVPKINTPFLGVSDDKPMGSYADLVPVLRRYLETRNVASFKR